MPSALGLFGQRAGLKVQFRDQRVQKRRFADRGLPRKAGDLALDKRAELLEPFVRFGAQKQRRKRGVFVQKLRSHRVGGGVDLV